MARIPVSDLSRYLLRGHIRRAGCLRARPCVTLSLGSSSLNLSRSFQTSTKLEAVNSSEDATTTSAALPVPLRKQLKDQAKALKAAGKKKKAKADNQTVPGWELTVGIEIHAQLNTPRKLFSSATTSLDEAPNTNVALFDLAMPGSQPIFQKETLIPAVRAALALNCGIQPTSRFDRKHYFHWDQPSGYQITQYYEPFAKDGHITLYPRDGIAPEDGESVTVGIKQVQMEQDTAKTIAQPGEIHWLDFNRVGVPLIEIITHPDIHHPATAAAFVRKVQLLLNAVDSCVLGMESGGLRADVNVSVRRTDGSSQTLGTRTEIKNLSSFKAVEDAIIAERDRQIALLEEGGVVEGETRGWSLGSTETRRLRGKEGEVDYRYMPDPDLGPLVIGEDLVEHLRGSMGVLPDDEIEELVSVYGLSSKDAISLMLLDNGGRIQYFYNVLDVLERRLKEESLAVAADMQHAVLVANWCLHELGKLSVAKDTESGTPGKELYFTPTGDCPIPAESLADILFYLHQRHITANVAKDLLWAVFRGDIGSGPAPQFENVKHAIEKLDLWFKELSDKEYRDLAQGVLEGEEKVLKDFQKFKNGQSKAYPQGKLMFLVGKMMREGPEQRMDPKSAETVMKAVIEERIASDM
ncbi:Glutamyl-tRNA amidotransferase subunit B, mitochondrial [Coniochaeta ligniaria NRRL 30616]|uniref:Glutamyl-tRNA(Gln) amidotransferase subunit B, mitochondrial n=1 Tax=Coniochaeta ligniaria NRRL 30616 TaxID=1408157 RepID=A0A1J7IHT5_9PEZI|nr:Glutamyl-tRNA amidotransferase subunit B, mitochondrial [Coniochaeta ligniaria NRRL 30616]